MIQNCKNIGITFSGGGTKGVAHAGVLKYLEELDIKPNMISATSAGAIVGALYAWGFSSKEILDFVKKIDFFRWKYFTLRKAGFIDSQALKTVFDTIFEDAIIGDLKIKLYITATDMVRNRIRIFDAKSKIVDAIMASCAFPGVMSPHIIDEVIYSDGGILNHFPTDVIQGRCDLLIGSYVSPLQKVDEKYLTSIKNVMSHALDLMQHQTNQNKFRMCDILIQPSELAQYSTFETNKRIMDKIFEIGYKKAKSTFEKTEVGNL
ncbi:patatin-like phospholipase family protein [Flavobacterium agricola]|uniref:Patatin-like phospholipase family protein n=1 Tax=Flavobacterium agricola TaxID=2870839 RepID=A0ABY6M0A9_9FLAO|nr:patatin-like phospholipase family protein [Flavobacterium agricola]UYW01257.1 patatin-like phospholipase family protein [Flavobacterium agricola]